MRAWWMLALLASCNSGPDRAADPVDGDPTAEARPADPLRDRIEAHIAAGLTERYDQPVDRVTCPPSQTRPLVCHAQLATDAWLPIDVTIDDANAFEARERPIVLLAPLADAITERYRARNIEVDVDCGGQIRAARPGEIFLCRAAAPAGKTLLVTAIVTTTQGRVTLHYPD